MVRLEHVLSGATNGWQCGQVVDTNKTWTEPDCQCTQHGFQANYWVRQGDSGAPVLSGTQVTGSGWGIGLIARTNGDSAFLSQALYQWDATLNTG